MASTKTKFRCKQTLGKLKGKSKKAEELEEAEDRDKTDKEDSVSSLAIPVFLCSVLPIFPEFFVRARTERIRGCGEKCKEPLKTKPDITKT